MKDVAEVSITIFMVIIMVLFISLTVLFVIGIINVMFPTKNGRFVTIDHTMTYDIIYDIETKVEYTKNNENGMYTMLVDAEGQPLLYKGE